MYGWAADNTQYWQNKQTFNVRASTDVYDHARTSMQPEVRVRCVRETRVCVCVCVCECV